MSSCLPKLLLWILSAWQRQSRDNKCLQLPNFEKLRLKRKCRQKGKNTNSEYQYNKSKIKKKKSMSYFLQGNRKSSLWKDLTQTVNGKIR